MARLGAGDTGGETIEESVKDSSGSDAGSDTSVEDRGQTIVDTGDQETNVTAPEPEKPARGRGGTSMDDAGADTSVEDRGQTIVDTGDQETNITQPEPDQPARGGNDTDSIPAVSDPEPQQPARGRGDEGSGTGSQTGGFGYIGSVDDNTAAELNRRISRVRGNLQDRRQETRDQQVSRQMDERVGIANRQLSRQRGNFRQAQQEQFGDVDVSFGTNTLTDEAAQREASEEYQQAVESATGEGGVFGESLIAEGLEYAGYDEAAETVEQTGRNIVRGGLLISNPADLALTATETAEYGIYGAQQYAEGDFEDFLGESREAGVEQARAFGEYIGENPAEAVGMGAGALIGSAAVMSAAGRISPRAGAATRYAIQPGEEIAGSAGFRATRAIGGEASAQRFFPNREPLIFSEEAAIRGFRGVSDRVRGLEYQSAETRFATSETEFEGAELGRSVTTEQAGDLVDDIGTTAQRARSRLEYTPARQRNPMVTRQEPTDQLGLSLAAQQETTIGTELAGFGGRARDRLPGVDYRPASERFVSVGLPARAELGTSLAAQQPTTIGTELAGFGGRAQSRLPGFEYTAAEARGVTAESDPFAFGDRTVYATEQGDVFAERNPLGTPMEGERRLFEGLQERYQRARYPQRGVEGYDSAEGRFDPTQADDVDAIWIEGEVEGMDAPVDPEVELESEGADERVAQVATAESDVGSNRIQTRTQTDTETEPTGVARELSRREPSFETETALRSETAVFEDQAESVGEPTAEVQAEPQMDAFAQPQAQIPFEGVRLDVEAPTEFEGEAEAEAEAEAEQELQLEQEAEQELEFELETETEAETRRELFGLPDFDSGAGDDVPGLFAAERGERVTDFIDPLTGERLE